MQVGAFSILLRKVTPVRARVGRKYTVCHGERDPVRASGLRSGTCLRAGARRSLRARDSEGIECPPVRPEVDVSIRIGQVLGHYRILRPLGTGGMGEVYEAEDAKLGRKVALKLLPDLTARDPRRRERFEREAKAIAALNHPNIVTIYSVEEAEGIDFITMELVEGQTLRQVVPRGGLALDAILKVAIPIADAVAAAHQQGITHRDLKPENILVGRDGKVKVLDFGLAKVEAA